MRPPVDSCSPLPVPLLDPTMVDISGRIVVLVDDGTFDRLPAHGRALLVLRLDGHGQPDPVAWG